MYVNKCVKCGAEFETKNPKRVICPKCLYADKVDVSEEKPMQSYSSYSTEQRQQGNPERQSNGYRNNFNNRDRNNGRNGYQNGNRQNGYQKRDNNHNSGYQQKNSDERQRDNRGFRNNYASGGRNNSNFQRKPNQNKRPKPQRSSKPLLISKEQLEKIEAIYKTMLPLPNPNAHEVIGEHIGLEPQKVFFGINLVRQKMMLPKLPFPKRKLAISADQLMAIKSLYEPLLPLPPIGCHKIIAAQLKMDEWRVHVGIKLVRTQLGLERWNEERTDKPADYMTLKHPKPEQIQEIVKTESEKPVQDVAAEEETITEVTEEKPKRGRKPKKKDNEE